MAYDDSSFRQFLKARAKEGRPDAAVAMTRSYLERAGITQMQLLDEVAVCAQGFVSHRDDFFLIQAANAVLDVAETATDIAVRARGVDMVLDWVESVLSRHDTKDRTILSSRYLTVEPLVFSSAQLANTPVQKAKSEMFWHQVMDRLFEINPPYAWGIIDRYMSAADSEIAEYFGLKIKAVPPFVIAKKKDFDSKTPDGGGTKITRNPSGGQLKHN